VQRKGTRCLFFFFLFADIETSLLTQFGQIICTEFGLTPAVCCEAIWKSLSILGKVLPTIHAARIKWPSKSRIKRFVAEFWFFSVHQWSCVFSSLNSCSYNEIVKAREPIAGNAGVWASLDGTTFKVQEPFDSIVEQNALYDGYKCMVSLTSLFVWAPDGTIVSRNTVSLSLCYCS
jgi:hypothetical protein